MKRVHCLLVIVVICSIGSMAYGQTLADVARQERDRKKSIRSKAVLTNGSVSPAAPAAGAAPAQEPPKEQAKDATPKGPTDNKGRGEKYWRDAFAKARLDLKRAEDRQRLLDLKANDLNSQLLREGIYTREVELRKEIDQTKRDQEATRKEVADDQKKLADLEDELRRSGGLPGWAR